jgi:uncharacterized protein (TIGR03066 family)
MTGKRYAASISVVIILIIFASLITCTTTSAPTSSQNGSENPSISTSSPGESNVAETPTYSELYYCGEPFSEECFITLNTVKSLSGNGPRIEYITMNQSPWIVNYYWSQISNIGYECSVNIWQGRVGPHDLAYSAGSLGFPNHASKTLEDIYCVKVYKTGDFTIQVEASGCKWWVKIGVEPDKSVVNIDQKMIVGKWQHGISDCPRGIDKSLCEKLKKLPENTLYYLEFLDDGQVDRLATGWNMMGGFTRYEGRYSVIGSKLEINILPQGYEAYEIIKLSEDELVLMDSTGVEQTLHRVN